MTLAAPLVAVDIGNSSTKLGLFDSLPSVNSLPVLQLVLECPTAELPPSDWLRRLPPEALAWRVASVQREGSKRLASLVRGERPSDDFRLLDYRDLPLQIALDAPERIGIDRLAAAVAANALRDPHRPAIVISAGTAVTINLVCERGVFQGGVILPGFRLSAQALSDGADLLPLALLDVEDDPPPVVGQNTAAAIRSGLFWGAVGSVREIVARMSEPLAAPPQVFVTGGDLRRLAPLVSDGAQFVPQMVLAGIALAERC